MSKFNLKTLCRLASVSLGVCYAGVAAAQNQENVIVVLDQTGTMQSPVGGGTEAKWEVAKRMAKDFVNLPHNDREYELWTFNGNSWTRHYSFADGAGKSVPTRQAELVNLINGLSCTPYLTPLAMTVCDAIDALIAYESLVFPPPDKRVALFTDGLENNSDGHVCHGPDSVAIYNETVTPRGGLDVDSWQWKVLNKAITGSPTSTAAPPPGFEVLVDIAALFETIPSSASTSTKIPTGEIGPLGMIYSTPLDAFADMKFFEGLSKATGGRYTQVDPATPPPTPGDVDGSGCTDYADYVQIMQFYGQQVSVPQSYLADLTRDGWVNYSDYLVVVQNWGSGPNC